MYLNHIKCPTLPCEFQNIQQLISLFLSKLYNKTQPLKNSRNTAQNQFVLFSTLSYILYIMYSGPTISMQYISCPGITQLVYGYDIKPTHLFKQ